MKKRLFCLLMAVALLLSGCCISHRWVEADCVNPKTCAKCEEIEGEALGHSWAEATCTAPKTCTVCAVTEGEALGHSWEEGTCYAPKTCTVCAATEGEILDHNPLWTPSTKDFTKMVGICTYCSQEFEEEVNWFSAGIGLVTGNWTVVSLKMNKEEYPLNEGMYLELRGDGTATLNLFDEIFEVEWETIQVDSYGGTPKVVVYYSMAFDDESTIVMGVSYEFGKPYQLHLLLDEYTVIFEK